MPSIKQIIILLIISGFIFTGFGYWVLPKIVNQTATGKNAVVSKLEDNTFSAGLEAAYNRLIARGKADLAVTGYGFSESKIISGKIKEVKDSRIILTVNPINLLADPALDERAVDINGSTKIYKQTEKTLAQINQDNQIFIKQMEEFNQKMKERINNEPIQPPRPPEPFNKQEIKLTDLKIGSQIMITAKDDIHAVKEFTALEIMAQFTK